MTKPVPISWAEKLADRVGAEAVIVLVFGDGVVAGTSYGETKAKCRIVGKWLDGLIDDLMSGALPAPDFPVPPSAAPRPTHGDE